MPHRPFVLSVLVVALLLPVAALAQTEPFHLAIVSNLDSNDVSILDTNTNTEVARIPTGPRPFDVAASPDGQFAYVGEDGSGTAPIRIDRINLVTLAVEDVLTIGGHDYLTELEISPDGQWLVAADIYQATTYIIDTANWAITGTVVLCPTCDGQTQQLYNAPSFAFSADSQTLYAVTSVNNLVTLVDLPTGTIVATRPTGTTGNTWTDIDRGPGEQVFVTRPSSPGEVVALDIPGGTHAELPITQDSVRDIVLVPSGSDTLVASGSALYAESPKNPKKPGERDFLSLFNLRTQVETKIPSSEALYTLRYNPSTHEIWSVCPGVLGFCVPFFVDVFDLATMTKTATLVGPSGAAALTRQPAFSPDLGHYYLPLGGLDTVWVVDTTTKQVVAQIPVGTNPRVVVAQGDVGPHSR